MNQLLLQVVLAEYALGKSAAYYLNTSKGWKELGMCLVAILCFVSFWLMLVFWDKLIKGIAPHEPEQGKLFQDLCNAHHLSRTETNYLQALIEASQIVEPANVFINPRYLDLYANQEDIQAKNLRQKLFA